jgi:hypothetical protein
MTHIALCTGKKKYVSSLYSHFRSLEKSDKLEILAHKQTTKRVAWWSYEELKILFKSAKPGTLKFDTKIISPLDLFQIKERSNIVANAVTIISEDTWLKFNLLQLAAPFRRFGGQFDVKEHIDRTRPERIKRHCSVSISGPVGQVFALVEKLLEKKLLDEKSIEYVI